VHSHSNALALATSTFQLMPRSWAEKLLPAYPDIRKYHVFCVRFPLTSYDGGRHLGSSHLLERLERNSWALKPMTEVGQGHALVVGLHVTTADRCVI
jgi:hypothetical protein